MLQVYFKHPYILTNNLSILRCRIGIYYATPPVGGVGIAEYYEILVPDYFSIRRPLLMEDLKGKLWRLAERCSYDEVGKL